jgi:hypothetical protein
VKTQVFVLVPYDTPPAEIGEYVRLVLDPHRFDPGEPAGRGRFDFLVGALAKSLNDPIAAGRLPPKVRREYSGNICERSNLPPEIVPGALVTPDGVWHDLSDFGWSMVDEPSERNRAARAQWVTRYQELIAVHENCWVVEVWAHS